MTHSPEPWKYIHPDDLPYGWDPVPDSASISDTETSMVVDSCKIADADRIVACVNFLQGIETEDLKLLMSNPMYFDNALQDINSAIAAAKGSCQ